MKEELRKLVESIKESTGKTQEDIAIEMGYKKNYISEMLSPKGKVTDKFLSAIRLRFSEAINVDNTEIKEPPASQVNEDPAVYNVLPVGDLVVTLKDYVTLLIETKNKAEEREKRLLALLEKEVTAIKSNSETIQADLEQVARMVRADDLTIMDSQDRIEGREVGTSSTEASIVERAFSQEDAEVDTNDSNDKKGNVGKVKQKRTT